MFFFGNIFFLKNDGVVEFFFTFSSACLPTCFRRQTVVRRHEGKQKAACHERHAARSIGYISKLFAEKQIHGTFHLYLSLIHIYKLATVSDGSGKLNPVVPVVLVETVLD